MDSSCDPKIYEKGEVVCVIHSIPASDVEAWVKKLAKKTGQKMDWHCFCGRDVVKTLGNLQEALKAAEEMKGELNEIGKNIWIKQLPGDYDHSYVQVQWPPTPAEEAAERSEREQRIRRSNEHVHKHLSLTEYVIEATNYEQLLLW